MTTEISGDVHTSVATLPDTQWNRLVEQSSLGSVFHRTGWLRAIEAGTDLTPRHVTAHRDGNLVGLLPNFVSDVSLPIELPGPAAAVAPRELLSTDPGFGGPLVVRDHHAVLDTLFEGVRAAATTDIWAHRIRSLAGEAVQYAAYFDSHGYDVSTLTCQLLVDLTRPLEDVLAGWQKDRRRTARKAREAGMTVARVDADRSTLAEFYDAYAAMIDRVDGVRYSQAFINAVASHLSDRLVLFRTTLDEETVGWHWYLRDNEQHSLHHFFSGLREEHFSHHPSSLLHEEAISWAVDEGYTSYNFGESNADVTDGGFGYKSQYGGAVHPILTWEKGLARGRWSGYRIARRV